MYNDYHEQALVWDWDAYDETDEHQYWCDYASQYGQKILIPMCALGHTGAYMAQKGFRVLAFDITPEMISEGKKRHANVEGLELTVADLLNLNLSAQDFDFAFIAGHGDLHLLLDAQDVGKAFQSINRHLRMGGCLALELNLPFGESWSFPKNVFHPRKPNYTDMKVWKENEGRYDAEEKRNYLHQTVYIEDANGTRQFSHTVCLQFYERDVILDLLAKNGFRIRNEYSNRDKTPWQPGESTWLVEAVKESAV